MQHDIIRVTVTSASMEVEKQISAKMKSVKSLCFVQTLSTPMPTAKLVISGTEIISEGTDVALFKKTDSIGLDSARYKIDPIEDAGNKPVSLKIQDTVFVDPYDVVLYLFDA